MLKRHREHDETPSYERRSYVVPMKDLTDEQLLQQILLTLERMEQLLISIDQKAGQAQEDAAAAAAATAEWVNANTAALEHVSPFPDSEPKTVTYTNPE